jgi:hypothetical protein
MMLRLDALINRDGTHLTCFVTGQFIGEAFIFILKKIMCVLFRQPVNLKLKHPNDKLGLAVVFTLSILCYQWLAKNSSLLYQMIEPHLELLLRDTRVLEAFMDTLERFGQRTQGEGKLRLLRGEEMPQQSQLYIERP